MRRGLLEKMRDAQATATGFQGVCYRNVAQKYANTRDVQSTKGSLIAGGRYNYKGAFGLLYLSCDLHTCLEETTKAAQRDGVEVAKSLPRTLIGFEVRLACVLDLPRPEIRQALNLSRVKLRTTDREAIQETRGEEAYTQRVGRLACEAVCEALPVPSAAANGNNLNVFTDRLRPGSVCRVLNSRLLGPPLPFSA